jgi:ATP-binding cassette subfamily B protein
MRVLAMVMKTTSHMSFSIRRYLGMDGMAAPLLRIMPLLMKYWSIYLTLFLLLFVDIALTLFFTWFLSEVTDAALSGEVQVVRNLLVFGAVMVAASLVSVYYETKLEYEAVNRIRRDLKLYLFGHMLRLPATFFASYHSGDLVSRLTNDMQSTEGAIGVNLLNLIRMPLMALAAFIYLMSIHWQLSLISLLLGPAALLIGGLFGKRIRDNSRRLQTQLGRVNGLLHDVFAGYSVVRAFAMENKFARRYESDSEQVLALERKDAKLMAMLQAGSSTVSLTSFFISLGIGAYYVAEGTISVGLLLAFVNLIQYLLYPFSGLAQQWGGLQRSLAAIERIYKVIDEKPDRDRFPVYLSPGKLHTGVRLEAVTFSYEGRSSAIRGIDLSIPAGQTVAIVGPSGAGKSTLMQLIMGFYKPDHGSIYLDDHRLQGTDPDLWRSYMSLVPQEPYLFTGTIRDNIAGGRLDATLEEVERAGMEANAHAFIMALPDGYDTWIGERGSTLSGGQKQRITIARAILKDAPILLLDEATSSLDGETEAAVKDALARLMQGKTTIMIAHRLSALAGADRIIVLDQGGVAEEGSHEQLMERDGLYARLYERR